MISDEERRVLEFVLYRIGAPAVIAAVAIGLGMRGAPVLQALIAPAIFALLMGAAEFEKRAGSTDAATLVLKTTAIWAGIGLGVALFACRLGPGLVM